MSTLREACSEGEQPDKPQGAPGRGDKMGVANACGFSLALFPLLTQGYDHRVYSNRKDLMMKDARDRHQRRKLPTSATMP